MQKPEWAAGQIYHVYNRGVEKRTIFQDNSDYFRFLHDLFEFNDEQNVLPSNVRLAMAKPSSASIAQLSKSLEIESPKVIPVARRRKLLVEILAFCLMPNHFHFLLRPKTTDSVPLFMQKLGIGYTMYFNKKYERVGPLFQGSFKAIAIEKDIHFLHLPYYIHANPVDLVAPLWRENKVEDVDKIIDFLEQYRWSSYRDFLGEKNFPSVTQRTFLWELLGSPSPVATRKYMRQWIQDFSFLHAETVRGIQVE